MIGAIRTSSTGMQGQTSVIDSTANNLANVSTTAYKRNRVDFVDLLYLNRRAAGAENAQGIQSPTGSQIGTGVAIAAAAKLHTQGPIELTDRQLDVAIEGKGFFRVSLPDGGIRYTRDGAFSTNALGQLVTSDGFLIQPPIVVPSNATQVSIGTDGTVTALLQGQTAPQALGRIQTANFTNPEGLSSEGRNLFAETAASGTPLVGFPGTSGTGLLRQGFLERSNVETVTELTNLILAQQAFTFNAEAIRVSNEMLRTTTDLLG